MPTFTNSMSVSVGDAVKASQHNSLADNTEFNRETADVDHDFDISTGDGHHRMAISAPLHVNVDGSTTWSLGFWQDSGGAWWLLINTASVSSFTRGDADAYVPLGDIADVPAS